MKKILFLLLCTVASYGQTYQNPTFGTVKTKTAPTVTTTPHLGTVEIDGTISKITPENLPVSTATENALFAKKDATSTAVTSTATLTNNGTTFTLSPLTGVIVDNSTVPSTRAVINFAGASNVTPLYFRTLLYIDNTGTLQQMNGMTTDLTPQQRVDNLFIGIVVYSGGTIQVVQLIPDIEYSIGNRFSTLADFIRNINEGNNIGANGANLQINKGAGYTFRRGSNFSTNREVPDVTTDAAQTPIPAGVNLIGYRNGSGGWTYEPYTGSLTPQFWDDGTGVKATVANNKFTNQRVYFFNGTNTYVIYLGRTEHATLETASTAAQNPDAIVDPATSVGSLIGTVSVAYNATALNNTAQARFTQGPRMQGGTGAGGASGSQNLQNTYLNSSVPQITTTALGAVTVQEGTGTDSNNVLVGKNNAGTTTFSVTGSGKGTMSSLNLSSNPVGSVANELKQVVGINDYWKIYGKSDIEDRSEMVLELGDNAVPFSANGQRFIFHYNNSAEGVAKSPFIIDYNEVVADANFTAKSIINSTAPATNALLANGTTLANPVSGSLSIGIIPKTTGASVLANSLITDSGTDVGVNGSFNNLSFVQNQLGVFSMGANSRTGVEIGSNMSATNTTNGVLAFTSQQSTEANKTLVSIASKTGSNVSSGIMSFSTANAGVLSEKAFLHPSGGFSLGSSTDPGAGTISATTYTGGATLTGTPTAPTATAGTNTTQIATTAFVNTALTGSSNLIHTTGNESKSGSLTFTNGTNSRNLVINSGLTNPALSLINTSGNTAASLRDGGAGQGHFLFGTNSAYIEGRESGPQYLKSSITFEAPAFVATNGTIRLKSYTVATLPAGTQGDTAYVTDATAPTYLGTLTGGGSVVCPVFYNGTAWVSH